MSASYTNPVYGGPCPDPFILKHRGEYWCYSTGLVGEGRAFGILHSMDLLHWEELGGALELLSGEHTCYWAPEVFYDNGKFYMYYSVGNETQMEIRVGVADEPGGPFDDSGRRLTSEEFAIDPHVFVDEDGQRYLFYATDFWDHTHIGTGTVVDRMLNPFELAGQPRPVSRARFDWQVYDPERKEKGGVRWHTVEGPFVLKHKGRYYQMFSGGNWQNISYGVSYATSSEILESQEWEQHCDGERVLPILRTLPEAGIIGPGHNSVVRGPDNMEQFCVYHRWVENTQGGKERVLAIDRMEWAGERLIVLGPTNSPQPGPVRPLTEDILEMVKLNSQDGRSRQLALPLTAPAFVFEVTLKAESATDSTTACYGLALHSENQKLIDIGIYPGRRLILVERNEKGEQESLPLAKEFDVQADHLLHLEVNGSLLSLILDHGQPGWQGKIALDPKRLTLFAEEMPVEFTALELTRGWRDDFGQAVSDPAGLGWIAEKDRENWQTGEGQLWHKNLNGRHSLIAREVPWPDYEAAVNMRLDSTTEVGGTCGICPALDKRGEGPLFALDHQQGGWGLILSPPGVGRRFYPLPADFDPFIEQHFRFRKEGDRLLVQWQQIELGDTSAPAGPCRIGFYAHHAVAAFELVRVVGITEIES